MARYTGPTTKIARKFGDAIFGSDKYFDKRSYPPGQHGMSKKEDFRNMLFSCRKSKRQNICKTPPGSYESEVGR